MKAEGELWFVGSKRTFEMLDWKPLDVGEIMAERAIEEWLGVDRPHGPERVESTGECVRMGPGQ